MSATPLKKKPAVSVVIPCYNAVHSMRKTLEAVTGQAVDFPFEILVVDSSDDGTAELIRHGFPDVRLIHLPHRTLPGSGRNLGVCEAAGDIVVFTDSDCVPQSGWLQGHYDAHQKHDCEAVGGSVINGYPGHYVAWTSHLLEFNEWTPRSKPGYIWNNPSCNLSLKREAFFRHGIEFTDNWPNEDTLFNWELQRRGGRIFFDPDLRVVHLNRMALSKLFKHQFRLGKAVAVERRITDLPGRIFLKIPVLCLGLPLLRWAAALLRLLKRDRRTMLILLVVTPLWLCGACAWAFGFMTKGREQDAAIRIHGTGMPGEGAAGEPE
ncbi:glycosyltransferase [bacterium]|nr:glycosyltransferase [bacterium]